MAQLHYHLSSGHSSSSSCTAGRKLKSRTRSKPTRATLKQHHFHLQNRHHLHLFLDQAAAASPPTSSGATTLINIRRAMSPVKHNSSKDKNNNRPKLAYWSVALLGLGLVFGVQLALGQSKGQPQARGQVSSNQNTPLPQSPGAQVRQQQQQSYNYATSPQMTAQLDAPVDDDGEQSNQLDTGFVGQNKLTGEHGASSGGGNFEDPLANSEPALYGSVAGQPGIDFPGYTRVPKTSFTCDNKGFDFGFYADEEAGCQVYHVCWSGRRESFLCGIGTVFNQAILACDYWHSVDCSKSSQFYGVNSELGKASAEPATSQKQQQQQLPRPSSSSSSSDSLASPNGSGGASSSSPSSPTFGEPINQRRTGPSGGSATKSANQNGLSIEQRRQPATPFDEMQTNLEQQQQQVPIIAQPTSRPSKNSAPHASNNFSPQRNYNNLPSYDQQPQQQQQRIELPSSIGPGIKGGRRLEQQQLQPPATTTTTTLATPLAVKSANRFQQQLPRFINMDFNQKVNSLIESPVRPPLRTPPSVAGKQRQKQQRFAPPSSTTTTTSTTSTTRRPTIGTNNFAQLAVARAQQAGSQKTNQSGARKKTAIAPNSTNKPSNNNQKQLQQLQLQQLQQQQQQQLDPELDEPQPQPQLQQVQVEQNSFDDSPVQTSTQQSASSPTFAKNYRQQPMSNTNMDYIPQQTIVQSGGSGDGSSAITMQYDTLTHPQQQQQQQQSISADSSSSPYGGNNNNNNYESSAADGGDSSSNSEDFRSAGAKAAASHNQNWYIMRAI